MDVVRLLIGAIIICAFLSVIYWLFRAAKKENKKYCEMKSLAEKHFELYMLMTYWTRMSIEGKKTSDYFKERDIRDIAIYGMNYVGETLLKDLNNTGVEVKYGIDRNYSAISSSIRIFSPQQKWELLLLHQYPALIKLNMNFQRNLIAQLYQLKTLYIHYNNIFIRMG